MEASVFEDWAFLASEHVHWVPKYKGMDRNETWKLENKKSVC